jgi:signal transduction histidine kinase
MIIDSERSPVDEIKKIHDRISSVNYLQELLESLPNPGFILDQRRQIVLSNTEFRSMSGARELEHVIGERPGDVVKCIYATKSPNGCNGSPHCQFCNVIGAILESQNENEKKSREARLITENNGTQNHLDLVVTSSPIKIEGEQFYLVTMLDITSEKRRKTMERVFFHDVLNLAHGLENTLHISQMNECSTIGGRTLENSRKITRSLIDEIQFQKNILSAESGDLNIKLTSLSSIDLLRDMIDHMSESKETNGKNLFIAGSSQDFTINTDRSLLRRILLNMIKNGLEASESGDNVILTCYTEGDEAVFTVQNKGVMSEEIRSQIWQRSFSTKGEDRGIGTYSMKLFTEDYLGGRIDFTSDDAEGTTFRIYLPLDR